MSNYWNHTYASSLELKQNDLMKYFLDIMEMIVAKSIHQKKYNIRLKELTNIDSISRKTESYYNLRDIQTFSSVDFSMTKVPII